MSFINNMQLLINNKEHRERLFCNNDMEAQVSRLLRPVPSSYIGSPLAPTGTRPGCLITIFFHTAFSEFTY